jgi:hypothetical protein
MASLHDNIMQAATSCSSSHSLSPKICGQACDMDAELGVLLALRVTQVAHCAGQNLATICSKNLTFLVLIAVRYLVGANLAFVVDVEGFLFWYPQV